MHAEPEPETPHPAATAPVVETPTPGEWAIGIVFVLAALGLVAAIAWAIAGLPA